MPGLVGWDMPAGGGLWEQGDLLAYSGGVWLVRVEPGLGRG